MSIYAVLNDYEPTFFSSNQGWSDVIAWTEDLDVETFPEVVHVAEHGYTEKLPELQSQLKAAIAAQPPEETVAATLAELIELLVDESGVLLINDGLGVDDGIEEEQPATEAVNA